MVGPVGLLVRSPNKQGGKKKYTSNVDVDVARSVGCFLCFLFFLGRVLCG